MITMKHVSNQVKQQVVALRGGSNAVDILSIMKEVDTASNPDRGFNFDHLILQVALSVDQPDKQVQDSIDTIWNRCSMEHACAELMTCKKNGMFPMGG